MHMNDFCRLLVVGVTALLSIQGVAQTAYPARPIRFIVPFAPGGGVDATARLFGQKMSEGLGQPVVVESRAGAGGNVGTEAVLNAAPDGYTVLVSTIGVAIAPNLQKLPWDPRRDLVHVSPLATYPLVITTHPATPGATLRELVAYAKANPGKLSYGSSGTGGPLHMGAELFKRQVGIDVLHVPYKGNAPATQAILAGEVSMTFDTLFGPLAHVRAGKLRALAVTGRKRSAVLPEVPTVVETGVADYVFEGWTGLSLPAATPREIVQRLNAEVLRVAGLPEVRDKLAALGYESAALSIAEFNALVASDLQRFGRLAREIGLRADQ